MNSTAESQDFGAPDAAPVFDRNASIEQVGGDAELLDVLIETYLVQEPALLASLQSAVEQGDGPAIRRAAHALVSSVSALGAPRSRDAARQLEEFAKHQQLERVPAAHRVVVHEFQLLRQSVRPSA